MVLTTARTDTLIHISGLKTGFDTSEGLMVAVDDVDLAIRRGRSLGLVGESGCGKSVTALSIMRLIRKPGRIMGGRVLLEGDDLLSLREHDMQSIRGKRISMIFQEPMTALNPVLTVGTQVMEAITVHERLSNQQAKDKTIEMLRLVGIPAPEKRFKSYPHEFSGGMRQRAMIAMALACHPDLLIADEPTTALDVTIQAQILDLIGSLKEQMGMAVLLITHDLGVVAEVTEQVAVMYAGKIVENAAVQEIFANPLHPYTQGLLASMPTLTKSRDETLNVIPGLVPNLQNLPPGCRFAARCSRAEDKCWEREPELVEVTDNHLVRCWIALPKGI